MCRCLLSVHHTAEDLTGMRKCFGPESIKTPETWQDAEASGGH